MEAHIASGLKRKEKAPVRPRLLAMALGTGLLAAVMAYIWLHKLSARQGGAHAVPTLAIVVAARDIPARTLVTKELLQVRNIAAASAPAQPVSAPTDIIGKVTAASVTAGSPFTLAMVAPRDISMGLAYTLPPSTRAIAIPLDPVAGVAGFIKPGDHVDVLATSTETNGRMVARIVLQNVTLLATGSRAIPGYTPAEREAPAETAAPSNVAAKPEEIPNATLLVTAEEAQKLVLASARGRLQLILRPVDEPPQPAIPDVSSAASAASAAGRQISRASAAQTGASSPPAASQTRRGSVGPTAASLPLAASVAKAKPPTPPIQTVRQTRQEAREATLKGVMPGEDACAVIAVGDKDSLRQVGDMIAGYKIVAISADGIRVKASGHGEEPWIVGDTRRLP